MTNNNSDAVSVAASICTTSASDMPSGLANHLYENGAFMVFLNVPQTTEFGIDYKSWRVGPKFLGLKMIPPGVHFIFFSIKTAPRIGFFHHFKEKEILFRKWDPSREDMVIEPSSTEEIERIRSNLKSMDDGLAPYPFETYRSWFSLSNHITEMTVERLRPENQYSRITGQAELVTLETEMMEKEGVDGHPSSCVDRDHPVRLRFVDEHGLPIMKIRRGFQIRFTELPLHSVTVSNNGENSLDRSWQLHNILADLNGEWSEFLGELQFAFVCFLMGQVYEGFEQWKRMIHLLCSCTEILIEHKNLYMALIPVLHFQLKECPEDFFVDIVSRDNFLTTTLSRLFGNINDCELTDATLKERAGKFKIFLTRRFKWNFNTQDE
uniref:Protein AAR2 homolog n=1 Tax=Setaria digitata TaxID=48799 RepID=A0A915Q0C9_9BILA